MNSPTGVMPLIYNSLDSEHLPVQERVLKTVPHLCEILDYGTVQNVLLVKIAVGCVPQESF
jgi:SCY1-like protein 2